MDLNTPVPEPVPLRPALRAVRVQDVPEIDPTLKVFDGGESLSEDTTEDEVAVDTSALLEAEAAQEEESSKEEEGRLEDDVVLSWLQQHQDSQLVQNEPTLVTRRCPLPNCSADVGVMPVDGDDVLGIGMSLQTAEDLHHAFVGHLQGHTLGQWVEALNTLHAQVQQGMQAAFGRPQTRIGLDAPVGVTPGPKERDPARAAAVAALDARLGRGAPQAPVDPQQAVDRDEQLRAARAARRAKGAPTPFDLTPKYGQDLEPGQVGIKY